MGPDKQLTPWGGHWDFAWEVELVKEDERPLIITAARGRGD